LIMEQVRLNFPGQEPPLSDLYQQQWMGLANFVVTPFYGKMSFASMLDPAYDLFVLVGAGAGGVRRKQDTGFDSKVSLMLDFGVGLRVYFTKLIALRLEFRNYLYPEPDATKSGFTSNLHFQGGVQFAFGGDE
jgi:outer membrane beta-barrel protein